jgi:hypothetical protein
MVATGWRNGGPQGLGSRPSRDARSSLSDAIAGNGDEAASRGALGRQGCAECERDDREAGANMWLTTEARARGHRVGGNHRSGMAEVGKRMR